MIESVHFQNFKALRDTTLPLGRFTLIVGPNNSGKSTALKGIQAAVRLIDPDTLSKGEMSGERTISVKIHYRDSDGDTEWWTRTICKGPSRSRFKAERMAGSDVLMARSRELIERMPIYRFDPDRIASAVTLAPNMTLDAKGGNLAGVLDRLRDHFPERFENLNRELSQWLPEFDRILFNTPGEGSRGFSLRHTRSQMAIEATDLSDGTLIALAILTVAHLSDSPKLLAVEEPDRGIHPRLLRQVQEALYRLSYPENFGESREPVQVIVTTHSPYFLDLFRDHPEEVVVAEKMDDNVRFQRLTDRPDFEEIMRDTPLGEAWYSGILGGVPVGT